MDAGLDAPVSRLEPAPGDITRFDRNDEMEEGMTTAKQMLEELMTKHRNGDDICYNDLMALNDLIEPTRPVPDGHYDVPKVHGDFWVMAQGLIDYVLPAFEINHEKHGPMLVIATEEAALYLTREQAKAFFHLTEYPPTPFDPEACRVAYDDAFHKIAPAMSFDQWQQAWKQALRWANEQR
jgi:hypothetical protein